MDLEKQQNTKQLLKNYLIEFFTNNLETIPTTKDRIEYVYTAMCGVCYILELFDGQKIKYSVEKEPPYYNLINFFPKNSHENITCVLEKGLVIDILFDLYFSTDQIEQINNLTKVY